MTRWYESNKTWHKVNENILREHYTVGNDYVSQKAKNDFLVGFPDFFKRKEKATSSANYTISEINAQNYFRLTK